jgi:hypothetical protein
MTRSETATLASRDEAIVSGRTIRALPVVVRSGQVVRLGPRCRNPWLSSTLGVAGELSAPPAQKQQRRQDWWISIKGAVCLALRTLLVFV